MEELGKWWVGESGKEKFWISLNLPGQPALGTIERGEDRKGPRVDSISESGYGPRQLHGYDIPTWVMDMGTMWVWVWV